MPKTYLTNYGYLKRQLSKLRDDPTKDWREYPCLLWDRGAGSTYGSLLDPMNRRVDKPSRLSFRIVHGEIPEDHVVCHHCDQPRCFRPVHLFAGTTRDNSLDMMAKGRRFQPDNKGDNHPNSKLNASEVRGVWKLYNNGKSVAFIAERFLVSTGTIWDIIRGITWKHVTLAGVRTEEIATEPQIKSRVRVNKYEYLKATLTALKDDPSLDWREYPCVEWVGATHEGYGILNIGGKRSARAHREAYELTHGTLEDKGLVVCHHCDNRLCFRPVHLFAGVHKDNVQDMIAKGRRYQHDNSGERSTGTDFCEDDVQKIHILRLLGVSNCRIAKMFGVHQPCISRITTGRRWKRHAFLIRPEQSDTLQP